MHERFVIGIDLGVTSKHVVRVLDTHTGEVVVKRLSFPHTAAGVQELFDRLARVQQQTPDAGFTAVMEPTGKMWIAIAAVLREKGIGSLSPSTELAAAYRGKRTKSGKSNTIDADSLARFPQAEKDRLHPPCLRDADTGDLHGWCKFHRRLSNRIAATKNAIGCHLCLVSPHLLDCFGDDRFSCVARDFMHHYVDPHKVKRSGLKRLTKWFGRKKRIDAERATQLAQHVYACAQSAVALWEPVIQGHGLPFTFEMLQAQVDLLLDQIDLYEKQSRVAEQHITLLYSRTEPQATSRSLPGFGKHIAPVVDSCVSDIRRFKNAGAFAAYVRTVPRHNSTGRGKVPKGQHERQPLRKDGNRYLQSQFYLAADVARRWDVDCAQCYLKFKANGLHHNQCVLVVAHKLALRYYALKRQQLTDPQACYEFRDEHGRPITKAEAKVIVERLYAEAEAQAQPKAAQSPAAPADQPSPRATPSTTPEPKGQEPTDPRRQGQPIALGDLLAGAAAQLGLDPVELVLAVNKLSADRAESPAQQKQEEASKNA